METPAIALKIVNELAARFPEPSPSIATTITWEGQATYVTLTAAGEGLFVSLGNAQQEVASLSEAVALLEGIFSDRIVAVMGYEKDELVHTALAASDDLEAAMPSPGHDTRGQLRRIDRIHVERWSGAES